MNPIDDHDARDLLAPLAVEPGGAQRLDLDQIMRRGDKRRRARYLMTGVMSGAAVFVLAGAAAAVVRDTQASSGVQAGASGTPSPYGSQAPAPDGTPTPSASQPPPPLPSAAAGPACAMAPLAGISGPVEVVDHTGHYTVEQRGNPDRQAKAVRTAVVRKDGRQIAAVTLPSSAGTEFAVNNKGEFAVTIRDSEKNGTPYAYAGGKLTRLKGGAGVAATIADSGRLAGILNDQPVYWKNASAEPTRLEMPEGAVRGGVGGIDQDGTMAGHVFTADMGSTALIWLPDGSTKVLPVPAQQNPTYLVGIRDGWVVGGTSQYGFRYNVATGRYQVLPAQGSNPQAVGGNGSVVAAPGTQTMYVLSGDTARQLAMDTEQKSSGITGISDDGRTVTGNSFSGIDGSGTATAEQTQAVTWTCD